MNKTGVKSILLRGNFHFIENSEYNFKGPMRRGLRPIVWYSKIEGEATSCALISNTEIKEGETKKVDLFILNEMQLKTPLRKGMTLNIGSIGHSKVNKFAEFKVLEHLGEWQGGKVA
jgi:hypothetical protein